MGKLVGIAYRTAKRGPMHGLETARVAPSEGVAGDFRGLPGPRQVTILSRDAWTETCADLGVELEWKLRRANLLIEGIDLEDSAGGVLRIGGQVVLKITGELAPCRRMDEAQDGLRRALAKQWRGGATSRVVEGGIIRLGDPVEFA